MSGLPLTRVDEIEKRARVMLRLIGPRVSAAQDERFTFRKCNICSPPEATYECFICRLSFPDKWRWQLHTRIDPETCQRYAHRWASKFAERV